MNEDHTTKGTSDAGGGASAHQAGTAGQDFLATFAGRLGGDALRYLPALVVPAVLSFASVAIFTRLFQPGAYGVYSLALAAAAIAVSVFGGWLEQSTVRYLPRYREQNMLPEFTARLSVLLGSVVVGLAALSIVFYAAGRSLLGQYEIFYFPCILLVAVTVVYTVYGAAFIANLQPGKYARYQVALAVGKLAFALLYVLLLSRNIVGLVIGAAVAYVVLLPSIVHELDVVPSVRRTSRLVDTEFARRVFLYGFPIVGQNMAKWLLGLSDRFVISILKGPEQVGIYAANYNLGGTVIIFVAGPLLFAAHSLIVNAWEGRDKERIQEVITTCSRYFVLATLPVGVFASVFSRQIASVLFGEAFREGYVIVPLVSMGMILFNFGFYGHKGIKLLEKTGLLFAMVLVCALVNVGLNLLLVPPYGYFGAGIATLVSFALYPVLVYWVTRRYLPWLIPWRSIRNIIAAALAAGGFWWLLGPDLRTAFDWVLFIGIGVGGLAVYFLVLLLVGELRDYEKRFLGSLFARIRGKGAHRN